MFTTSETLMEIYLEGVTDGLNNEPMNPIWKDSFHYQVGFQEGTLDRQRYATEINSQQNNNAEEF